MKFQAKLKLRTNGSFSITIPISIIRSLKLNRDNDVNIEISKIVSVSEDVKRDTAKSDDIITETKQIKPEELISQKKVDYILRFIVQYLLDRKSCIVKPSYDDLILAVLEFNQDYFKFQTEVIVEAVKQAKESIFCLDYAKKVYLRHGVEQY